MTFAAKCKKTRDFLSKLMETIIESEKRFEKNRERVQSLNMFLYEYERQSVQSYSPAMNLYLGSNQAQKTAEAEQQKYLLFQNPNNKNMQKDFDDLSSSVQNPFTILRHWMKQEMQEIEAVQECCETRRAIEKKLRDTETKHREDSAELRKLEAGGMTMKSFWMSKEAVQAKMEEIRRSLPEQDVAIQNYKLHMQILTLQQARCLIPFFQQCKAIENFKNVGKLTCLEVAQSKKVLQLFKDISSVNTGLIQDNVSFWRDKEADMTNKTISFSELQRGKRL